MRFVTPDLDDPMKHPKAVRRAVAQQQQAVLQAFQDHKERIRPLLPPALQRLQDTYVHDARIRSLRIDAGQRTLQLCLLCCDSPGCFDLTLNYKEIQLTGQETSLLCFIAHVDAEIYWGEVDLTEDTDSPVFIHRILWQTRIRTDREPAGTAFDGEALYRTYTLAPEIELRFGGFGIEITPNPENQLSRGDDFITVVRDPAKIEGMPLPSLSL